MMPTTKTLAPLLFLIAMIAAPVRAETVETLDDAIEGYVAQAAAPKASDWQSDAGVGLTYKDGNSDILTLAITGNAKKVWEKNALKFAFQGIYSRDQGVETASEWIMVQRFERTFGKDDKQRFWQQLWVETDSQEDLALRLRLTAGWGYRLAKTADDKFVMWGEIGAGYNTDNFYGGADNNEWVAQVNLDWTWKITKTLTYRQVIQWIPSLTNGGEYQFFWNSNFSMPISKRFEFNLTLQDKYNTAPAAGTEKNDFTLLFTLTYKFTAE
jgi:putative salt-induced outer membrane protein YdiY